MSKQELQGDENKREEKSVNVGKEHPSGEGELSPRPAQDKFEWVSAPARPLAVGDPAEYQSFGCQGLIATFGSRSYIYGKDVPFGARVKVTTEILPAAQDDINAMLDKVLPPLDAPVFTVHWNDQFPPYCHICHKQALRDEEYYKFGGFHAHKKCVDKMRQRYAPERDAETTTVR